MNAITNLTTRVQIERVISEVADLAPWRIPLYRAARDGLVHVVEPSRTASIPKSLLTPSGRPTILMLGDDDYVSTGPDGWTCAKRIKYWAAGGIVHAAGGDPRHYAVAVQKCLGHGRVLLVETDSAHRDAWVKFLRPAMPLMTIVTRNDAPHPCRPPPGEIQ